MVQQPRVQMFYGGCNFVWLMITLLVPYTSLIHSTYSRLMHVAAA